MTSDEKTAVKVLTEIALSGSSRPVSERQRAIDALTLFHEKAKPAFEKILKKADNKVIKDRVELYIQRIDSGALTSMNI